MVKKKKNERRNKEKAIRIYNVFALKRKVVS